MFDGLLQPTHLIVILVIALLVVGPKKLPEMGKSLGSGMRGFKDAISGNDDQPAIQAPEPQVPVAPTTVQAAASLPNASPTAAAVADAPATIEPASEAAPVELHKD